MTAKSEKKEKKAAEQPDALAERQKKLEDAEAKAGEYLQMAQRLRRTSTTTARGLSARMRNSKHSPQQD